MDGAPYIEWTEDGQPRRARWHSERGAAPPKRVELVDDTLTADHAYSLAGQGTALLWRGDFQNARQLLIALARRVDRGLSKPKKPNAPQPSPVDVFNQHRQAQSQRARTLGMLLIELGDDHAISLRRAPDLREACIEAYGAAHGPSVVSLRELLGLVGAHEWRTKGMEIPAAGGHIHPHYGVFAPVRSEYIDLVAKAPLPEGLQSTPLAFDIGTGTGVLAAVLAKRGVRKIIATDQDPRALACARENVTRLGMAHQIDVVQADLFPEGKAALIVCNPPWIPARPSSPLEHAVYDPESRMLLGFLRGVSAHLAPNGEGWLILSDLAEHLGLRTRQMLLDAIAQSGLAVIDRMDVRPRHPRAADPSDPFFKARAMEVTSLWRLAGA